MNDVIDSAFGNVLESPSSSWAVVRTAAELVSVAVLVAIVGRRFSGVLSDQTGPRPPQLRGRARSCAMLSVGLLSLGVALQLVGCTGAPWSTGETAALIAFALTLGLSEELAFRGVLLAGIRSRHSEFNAWLGTTLAFSLAHGPAMVMSADVPDLLGRLLASFLAGSAFYLARRVTGNLLLPIVLHAGIDLATWLSRGPLPGPPLFESSLVEFGGTLVVLSAVMTVVALVMEFRRREASRSARNLATVSPESHPWP